MALCRVWQNRISTNLQLLASAIEEGLHRLGYDCIKEQQLDAVESMLKGNDVFVSVPTGFGKSLVYQILPFCAEYILCHSSSDLNVVPVVVVIWPLLSLMDDQVSKLASKDVKAGCISGTGDSSASVLSDMVEGKVTHIFGSPEAFIGNKMWHSLFMDDAFSCRVVALAIDEAHCIVKWLVCMLFCHYASYLC